METTAAQVFQCISSFQPSFTVVQNKLTAFWFKDKELALAFGITLAFSRLGSVLNFFLTETFTDAFGLKWTLWGGKNFCYLLFLS